MEGTVSDPRFLGVVYGAPMDADWTDPETWRKANPSFGAAVHRDAYEDEYNAVKANPAEQNEFRIFQLSQWVGQAERFIPMSEWKKGDLPPKPANKRIAFGGLDLSATTDLSAFSVVAPNEDGSIDLFTYPFLPTEGPSLLDRMKRDGANYDLWAKQGYLHLCEGPVIDQEVIKQTILQVAESFDLRDVGLDRHFGDRLKQELEAEGITMIPINQGYPGMSSPTKEFLAKILKGQVHHGGNPLLQWCVDHFTVKRDSYGNVMPDKMRAQNRIDPVAASIMAFDGWDRRGKTTKRKSAYSAGGFYDQFLPDKETASAA
jgi:phage terminase large subunit-like protein